MRHLSVILVAALTACASSAPISFLSTTPSPQDGVYGCALRKVNELGYTVTNTSKDGGFITAQRQSSSGFDEFMSGKKSHDVITVSIFDEPDGTARRIRATVGQTEQATGLFSKASTNGTAPSEKGIADANAVLAACGKSPAIRQEVSAVHYIVQSLAQ